MSEPVWIEKDLGTVDSYAEAVAAGYTGTHEEFARLLANVGEYSEAAVNAAGEAENAATTAEDAAEDAEAYAVGKRNGEEVDEDDPAYHNNAEYYAEIAGGSAMVATDAADTAKAAKEAAEAAAAQEVSAWLAEHVDPDTGYVIDDTLTIEDAAADAAEVGNQLDIIKKSMGDEVEYAKVTQTIDEETINGVTVTALSDNTMEIYGTPSNARHMIFLNGQNATKTSSGAFSKTLEAGVYDIDYESTGTFDSAEIFYTKTTFASKTKLVNGVVNFDDDVMLGLWLSTNNNYGTAENPTVLSFSAKRIMAKDIAAREDIEGLKDKDAQIDATAEDIRDAGSATDDLVNDLHCLINYGYDTPYFQPEKESGSWNDKTGVKRDGEIVVINKQAAVDYNVNIRLDGEVMLAPNTSTIEGWTGGIELKAGHRYRVMARQLAGECYYDTDGGYEESVPVRVYVTGTSTTIGELDVSLPGRAIRTFTAEEGTTYIIAMCLSKNKYLCKDAKFLVTMEDLTEKENRQIMEEENYRDASINRIIRQYDISYDMTGGFTFKDGKRIVYTTGVIGNYSSASASNFVYVGDYNELVLTMPLLNSDVSHAIAFYELANEDSYLSSIKCSNDTSLEAGTFEYRKIAVPAGAKYMRTTWWASTEEQYEEIQFRCVGVIDKMPMVPDYYFEDGYLDDKIDAINTIGLDIGKKSFRAIYFTDYHLEDNARVSPALISYLIDRTGIRNVVFGGDSINHDYASKLGGFNLIRDFLEDFKEVREKAHTFLITGNHEMNNADTSHSGVELSKKVPFNLFNEPLLNKIQNVWTASRTGTNTFYIDDDAAKMRIYCVDCNSGSRITKAYLDAILPSFLTVPEGYSVLVFSHIGSDGAKGGNLLANEFEGVMQCAKLMDEGAHDNVTVTISGTTYTWDMDFTGKQRQFIGAITGHRHFDDLVVYEEKYPVIVTLCDTGAFRSSHKERIPYTITEQAFDVVQVDVETQRIYCTRIGYGNDRVISFGEGAGPVEE